MLQSHGYLQQLTGWDLNDLLFSRIGIVLVMTLNIFPVVYFAVSRSLLASGQRLAIVACARRQRLASVLAHHATDAFSGPGGGDAAGVYPGH